MKETFKKIFIAIALTIPTMTIAQTTCANNVIQINLEFQKIDKTKDNTGIHRTPVQIPNVYLDNSASSLIFENPCYECTLELVVPGTETVAYTYSIPDGDDTVQLPTFLSGVYELHLHRGNYCFWGMIELD